MFWKKTDKVRTPAPKRVFFKELEFGVSTFTSRTDPDVAAIKNPEPIKVAASQNPIYTFGLGEKQTDAGNEIPIAQSNLGGSYYEMVDAEYQPLELHYIGMAFDANAANVPFNEIVADTMQQSIADASASMYTELPFFQCEFDSDLPGLTAGENAMHAFAIFYQTALQNFVAPITAYNSVLTIEDLLLDEGFQVEAPYVTELFSQMKKTTFFALLENLGKVVHNEYFDLEWYKDIAYLNGVISRDRTEADCPIITIKASHVMPHVRMRIRSGGTAEEPEYTTILDTMNAGGVGYDDFNNIKVVDRYGVEQQYNLQTLTHHILEMFDPHYILHWARGRAFGTDAASEVDYINELSRCFRALIVVAQRFKQYTSDFKTVLNVLNQSTTLVRWVIGATLMPMRPRVKATRFFTFKLVKDIVRSIGCAGAMVFDAHTMKWRVTQLWLAGYGLPDIAMKEGGFAIMAGTCQIDVTGSPEQARAFPILFTPLRMAGQRQNPQMLTRRGRLFAVDTADVTPAALRANPYFSYLDMNRILDVPVSMPSVILDEITGDTLLMSTITHAINVVYGIGICSFNNGGTLCYAIPYNAKGYLSREYSDVPSNGITYAHLMAPFPSGNGTVPYQLEMGAASGTKAEETLEG